MSAGPLALVAWVRYDSTPPRWRPVHTPEGTPRHPRARGGCRSRGWCAPLPVLIHRLRLSCLWSPSLLTLL